MKLLRQRITLFFSADEIIEISVWETSLLIRKCVEIIITRLVKNGFSIYKKHLPYWMKKIDKKTGSVSYGNNKILFFPDENKFFIDFTLENLSIKGTIIPRRNKLTIDPAISSTVPEILIPTGTMEGFKAVSGKIDNFQNCGVVMDTLKNLNLKKLQGFKEYIFKEEQSMITVFEEVAVEITDKKKDIIINKMPFDNVKKEKNLLLKPEVENSFFNHLKFTGKIEQKLLGMLTKSDIKITIGKILKNNEIIGVFNEFHKNRTG